MDLFEWSQNIMKVNQNKVISDSIKNVNDELNGLTKDYYLIDLTYSQFVKNIEDEKVFTELLNKGYQKINNELWIQYLRNILRNNNVKSSIDEAFNKEISNNRINL